MINKKFKLAYFFLALIVLIHIFLLSRIVFFPYPEMFVYPYLTSKGLLPYKEIMDQHFPGLFFFPVNFYTLGIRTPEAFFVLNIIIVFANHLLLFLSSRKIFKSFDLVLISNFFYFLWHPFLEGYVLWIDSFASLIFLFVFYLILRGGLKSKFQSFLIGFIIGISILFKQVSIIFAVFFLSFLFYRKRVKTFFLVFLGIIIPLILMFFYFVKINVIKDFIFWTFTFNLTTFAKFGRKMPTFFDLLKAGFIFIPSFLAIIFLNLKNKIKEEVSLLIIFLIASFAFVFARFDFVHLQPSLPFVSLLTVYFYKYISNYKRLKILIIFFYFLGSIYLIYNFYHWAWGGEVFFFGGLENSIVEKVNLYSNQSDSVFAFGTTPHLYFLAERLPPGRVFVFQFPWFMMVAEEKILEGIIRNPPKIVVQDKNSYVQGMNLVSFMPRIGDFIRRNYNLVDKIDRIEILVKQK